MKLAEELKKTFTNYSGAGVVNFFGGSQKNLRNN